MIETMSTLSERLRFARKLAQLSQEELGRLAHVSQAAISKIERGEQDRTTYIIELADVLNISESWLSTGEGEMTADGSSPSPTQSVKNLSPKERALLGLFSGMTQDQQDELLRRAEDTKLANERILKELNRR